MSKKVPPKFEPWIAEQQCQDRLQRDSWWRDQSVIEPGRNPEAPLFGPSRELQLTTGNQLPTIYTQRITPTDIAQLQDENQKLRNKVLERMKNCEFCDVQIALYETDGIRKHHENHVQQLRTAGLCPTCGDTNWLFWSVDLRKDHLHTHQVEAETKQIKQFWGDLQCPVCDTALQKMPTDDILQHMADHQAGLLKFCDRCSLNLQDCCQAELSHHKRKCLQVSPGEKNHTTTPAGRSSPSCFCDKCGMDRTFEDDEARRKHRLVCRYAAHGFCAKCGIELSLLNQAEEARHMAHCRPPGGMKKSFCKRCATDLDLLDAVGQASHATECYLKEPSITSERERILGM